MSKFVTNVSELRDPEALPKELRNLAKYETSAEAKDILEHAASHIEAQEQSFNLRWNADMRAIKRWQEATGKTKIWPDHTDLCVWLLEQLESE